MKLSEAIRLGSMLGPQVYGSLFGIDEQDQVRPAPGPTGESCAMGAALMAAGISVFQTADDWPWITIGPKDDCLNEQQFEDPGVCVWDKIVYLNNERHWTRERIADWVESLEAQNEAAEINACNLELAMAI